MRAFSGQQQQEPRGREPEAARGGGLGLASLLKVAGRHCPPLLGSGGRGREEEAPTIVIEAQGDNDLSFSSNDDDSFLWESWGTPSWRRMDTHKTVEDCLDVGLSEASFTSEGDSEASLSSPPFPQAAHRRACSRGGGEGGGGVDVAADAREIIEYAQSLGIDPLKEPHLLKIAEEGLLAPLPRGWTQHEDDNGNIYYHNPDRGVSEWVHPLDSWYRERVETARSKYENKKEAKRAVRRMVEKGEVGARINRVLRLHDPPNSDAEVGDVGRAGSSECN